MTSHRTTRSVADHIAKLSLALVFFFLQFGMAGNRVAFAERKPGKYQLVDTKQHGETILESEGDVTGDLVETAITKHPGLVSVKLVGNAAVTAWVPQLERLKDLRELTVELPYWHRGSEESGEWTKAERALRSAFVFEQLPNLPGLTKINLRGLDLRDEDFALIAKLQNLEEVILYAHHREFNDLRRETTIVPYTAQAACVGFGKLPKLRVLNMTGYPWEGPVPWEHLAQLPRLEELIVYGLDDKRLPGIETLRHLKKLVITGKGITNTSWPRLLQLRELETFWFGNTSITSQLERLFELPNLQHVSGFPFRNRLLPQLNRAEQRAFVRFTTNSSLQHIDRDDILPLAEINATAPGLTRVTLANDRSWGKPPGLSLSIGRRELSIARSLIPQDFEQMQTLTDLRVLIIDYQSDAAYSDEDLGKCRNLPNLEELTLKLPRTITNGTLAELEGLTVQKLTLHNVNLDARAARSIATFRGLQHLSIREGILKDVDFAPLAACQSLERIELSKVSFAGAKGQGMRGIQLLPNLKHLSVSAGDAECRWISRCPRLETLSIFGRLTPAGLENMEPMLTLQRLTLSGACELRETDLRAIGRHKNLEWFDVGKFTPEFIAQEFEFGVIGDCSCGCLDVRPVKATQVPDYQLGIVDGRLAMAPSVKAELDTKRLEGLRITSKLEADTLVIDRRDLPVRLSALYLNDCHARRLELIDCGHLTSIGVFGTSEVGEVVLRNTSPAQNARLHSSMLILGGVGKLAIEDVPEITQLTLNECSRLTSVQLLGDFPNLTRVHFDYAPHLKYLSLPHRGEAKQLQFLNSDGHNGVLSRLPALRLLKLPGTTMNDNSSPYQSQIEPPLPPLVEVDLRSTPITDTWLARLAQVRSLKILRVKDCRKLTGDGLAEFRRVRPDVKVVTK